MLVKMLSKKTLSGKTILITGATGLIGSALVKMLFQWNEKEKADLHILALVRSSDKARTILGEYQNSDALKLISGGGATP